MNKRANYECMQTEMKYKVFLIWILTEHSRNAWNDSIYLFKPPWPKIHHTVCVCVCVCVCFCASVAYELDCTSLCTNSTCMCFCVDVRLGVCVTVRACGCVGGVCAAVWVHALKHVARAHTHTHTRARAQTERRTQGKEFALHPPSKKKFHFAS